MKILTLQFGRFVAVKNSPGLVIVITSYQFELQNNGPQQDSWLYREISGRSTITNLVSLSIALLNCAVQFFCA